MTRAAEVLAHARSRPCTLGDGRLVCVDGPAGSGKTTLAGEIAAASGAPVVHLDDLYAGWKGIFTFEPATRLLLDSLAAGDTGYYRRYDWTAGDFRETHHVNPSPLLVLEGVGAGSPSWSALTTTLVWVEAVAPVRLARGMARDGEAVHDLWVQWMADEQVLFGRHRTRDRADLLYNTSPA
jgi:uridine kinase